MGFTLGEQQLEQFQLYCEMLVDWNSRVNLTAITTPEGIQVRHFVDSLTVASALLSEAGTDKPPPGLKVLDIGTGAGFPGLPLKILWPRTHLALADSIAKKATFLKAVCAALHLTDVEVLTARAEELGQDRLHRQQYTVVTARAVASLPVLCEYCLPLTKTGGWILLPKKGDISHELQNLAKATRVLGGSAPRLHNFVLPGEAEERCVVAVRKARPTPAEYPRRVGLAKSRPLGSD